MYCSKCGTLCPEDANFCHRCGAALYREPAPEAEVPVIPVEEPEPAPQPELIPEEPEAVPVETEEAAEEPTEEAPVEPEDEEAPPEPEADLPEEAPLPDPSRGRRSLRIGLAVLLFLISIGMLCYGLLPHVLEDAYYSDPQMSWFRISQDGALGFLPERYTGGSELYVPETVAGIPVTSLEAECFADCTELVTIHLPQSVTAISDHAFYGCSALRGIYLPDKLQSIGKEAFSGCTALEALSVPASVTDLALDAFSDCPKLLYIFYAGTSPQWALLYPAYITPYTQVICSDGVIRQKMP